MCLYPPAGAILREALSDIEIDGYVVPKGRNVFLPPYTIQRNPTYFPNQEIFDPEHFTLEQEKQLPRYAYIPLVPDLAFVSVTTLRSWRDNYS